MGATSPEEMATAWEKMINARDIEGVLGFYEPEAVVVLPKEEGGPVKGSAASGRYWTSSWPSIRRSRSSSTGRPSPER